MNELRSKRNVLVTPYFKAASSQRQNELDECLAKNISCHRVDEIILLIDDGHMPSLSSSKLTCVHIDHRPTYRDWVDLAKTYVDSIIVLANSDIYFDDSIDNLAPILAESGHLVALTRYEKIGDKLTPHPNPQWSQDVWAISSDETLNGALLNSLNIPLGVPRCDNKIVYLFKMHGWEIHNPYPFITTVHVHESQHRSYNKQRDATVVGGVGYAYPAVQLTAPSKIDIHVWPVNSRGISSVKLNKTLDDWLSDISPAATTPPSSFIPFIDAVLIPVIKREIPDLLRYFFRALPPTREAAMLRVFLSLDQVWSESDKHIVLTAIQSSAFHGSCKSIAFLNCNIPEDQSVYIRNVPKNHQELKLTHGLKTGPNRQFFESLRQITAGGGINSVILQEVDTIPLRRNWIDSLNSKIKSKAEAIHFGCVYSGADRLNEEQLKHLNGNAIYCIGNPRFSDYAKLWESLLLEVVKHAPWKAYDSAPEWAMVNSSRSEIAYFKSVDFQKFTDLYKNFVYRLPEMVNMGGVEESKQDYLFDAPGFSIEFPKSIVLHCKGAVPQSSILSARLDPLFRPAVLGYDGNWQYPAITEKHAYTKARELLPADGSETVYFGFPWATLIDQYLHVPSDAARLRQALKQYSEILRTYKRVVTVCQHVHMLEYQELFAESGITDIFWSHATHDGPTLPLYEAIRIQPFPLFPVQGAVGRSSRPRKALFTFIGAKAPKYYLTDSRNIILDELAGHPLGIVRGRNSWHYAKAVYGHQIKKELDAPNIDDAASAEFRRAMVDSVFSLCPSGSGPNSIRLWEAMTYGCIPVIMADTYLPPGEMSLWSDAAVFCRENAESIKNLPDLLSRIASDHALMERKRKALDKLASRYGTHCFIYDMLPLFYPKSTVHMTGFRDRVSSPNACALIHLAASAIDPKNNSKQYMNRLATVLASYAMLTDQAGLMRLIDEHVILKEAVFQLSRHDSSALERLRVCFAHKGLDFSSGVICRLSATNFPPESLG